MESNLFKLLLMERLLEETVKEDQYTVLIQADLEDALIYLSHALHRLEEEYSNECEADQ